MLEPEKQKFASKVRNLVFGAEDSLVSTVGLLSGIVVAEVADNVVLLTGIILIFVEAFSMGVGSLLSEHGSSEFMEGREVPLRNNFVPALIMFLSYFAAGFIPLAPYFFIPARDAIWFSIILALVSLFILGLLSARVYKINIIKHGLQMLLIGGGAVLIGAAVGRVLTAI